MNEFAASRHGIFNLSQAAQLGLSSNDIRRLARDGIIVRVRPSVWRFTAHPQTWRQLLYATALGHSCLAAGRSAAALHRLDGLEHPPGQPQLLVPHGRRPVIPDAIVRSTRAWPSGDFVRIDGIECTTLARTVCDLAAELTHDQLVRCVDDVQRRGASMRWMLEQALELQSTGRSGPSAVADVVRRRLVGYTPPDSWFERLLHICLASPIIGTIVRQHELRDSSGNFVARFDLAVPWVRLGIEGHSRRYHVGELAEH
ncbi:MAG TPA: type IV toxin-antitoxin system AbiEi family antitoxin domain-containing protein, partial [Ilumatobacteraceae bacterium]